MEEGKPVGLKETVAMSLSLIAAYLFGGWSALLEVLVGFVAADYTSGMIAAGVEGKLSSSVGFKGVAKKVAIFLVVAVAHLADRALGGQHLLRDAAIYFYLGNELLSIIENLGRAGVPVPALLKQAVDILRAKGEAK